MASSAGAACASNQAAAETLALAASDVAPLVRAAAAVARVQSTAPGKLGVRDSDGDELDSCDGRRKVLWESPPAWRRGPPGEAGRCCPKSAAVPLVPWLRWSKDMQPSEIEVLSCTTAAAA
mmetsp:Transcript_58129/g.186758  ORF Transcript_58129/g.186758 Transcript_58129/m.186758 type:complete len:121 (-) Transcript_58129:97-459(-)